MRLVNELSVPGQSKSFRERALGPFEVVETFNDVNFCIACCATGKSQDVHNNRLRPYRARADTKFSSLEHPLNNEDNQGRDVNVPGLVSLFKQVRDLHESSFSPHALTLYNIHILTLFPLRRRFPF
jgi:hypothetical protein